MSQSGRPTLKLKLSQRPIATTDNDQSPNPQSAVARTPSLKLKVKTNSSSADDARTAKFVEISSQVDAVSSSFAKLKSDRQRKPSRHFDELHDGTSRGSPKPTQRLKVKVKPESAPQQPQTARPGHAQTIKLKHKGKIPKRPLGVGYDSELEDREADPVILDGFLLRFSPGVPEEEFSYVQDAINNGTVGVHTRQGGADIRMRQLDIDGRRGIFYIRGKSYATTMVDLPCLIGGDEVMGQESLD